MTADLARLAAAHGVATEYWDQSGTHRAVSADTVRAVLGALGVPADTDEAVQVALERARLRPWRRVLPPVLVLRDDRGGTCPVHVPHGSGVRLTVTLEDGAPGPDPAQVEHLVAPQQIDGVLVGEAMFALPAGLPTGWHRLDAQLDDGTQASCPLVVTPARIAGPARRGWGIALQLYAARSSRSWGIGDLADLADLARWAGFELGADFLLVNPLDAAAPSTPMEPSPYLPVSRRFVNPLYLRVEEVPEYAYLSEPSRVRVAELATLPQARVHSADLLDRNGCWAAKRAALELVQAVPRSPGRQAAYAAYCEREGAGLEAFATWCALVEEHGDPVRWPAALRDPGSPQVAARRAECADRVEFHRWVQWLLDDQLAAAHEAAVGAGMAIGVLHDLPVGVHRHGADVWARPDVFAGGVTVGAPPDAYNQRGQDWSQPPLRPDALAEAGYAPYRDMLRTVLRHAGGLRVDHVLGLFRLWWIPEGRPAAEGTYVAYDHEALVGILALEAQRAGAIVVGEDLGTVERWVQDMLQERGILGTSILWFERRPDGSVPAPQTWRSDVLASVTTHDLPPTAGYLAGDHVDLRARLGLLAAPVAQEWAAHERERQAWLQALRAAGLLPPDPGTDDVVRALHRYLARTPARLVALSLPDAAGDRRSQNQPGTHREYPNWQLPLTDELGRPVLLDDLARSGRLAALAAALTERAAGRGDGAPTIGP